MTGSVQVLASLIEYLQLQHGEGVQKLSFYVA